MTKWTTSLTVHCKTSKRANEDEKIQTENNFFLDGGEGITILLSEAVQRNV